MSRVLIIATSKFTRGGITAVINAHQKGEQWKRFHCCWIGYHVDRSACIKILFLMQAFVKYLFLLPFYQIIHFQFSLQNDVKRTYPFFVLAKLLHKKTIVHLHCGDQLPDIWSWRYEKLFTQSDLALVLSPSIKRKVEEYIGPGHNVEVLYNPCPQVSHITPFEKREKEILFAGTLDSNKGYSDLIKGFAKVVSKHQEWKVVFAGNGEVEKAKALAKSLGVDNQCQFLGWVNGEQKDAAFRSASVLCLASYAEGFPMAVLDAWAYGIPVVATPAGGLRDIIQNGSNGLLFEAGNTDKIAQQLERIIEDVQLRKRIAEASKIMAETKFNIGNINKRLFDLYEDVSKAKLIKA